MNHLKRYGKLKLLVLAVSILLLQCSAYATKNNLLKKHPYDFFVTAESATLSPIHSTKGYLSYLMLLENVKVIDVSESHSNKGIMVNMQHLPKGFWNIKNKKSALIGQLPHDLRKVEAYMVMVSDPHLHILDNRDMLIVVHSVRIAHSPNFLSKTKVIELKNVHLYIDPPTMIGMSSPQW